MKALIAMVAVIAAGFAGLAPNVRAQDSACVIISEVVHGAGSGGCPVWMEITNTGAEPYTFPAGGVIVQAGTSSDVVVDISLTGVTIDAGEPFVIESRNDYMCTGAFYGLYGFQSDMTVLPAFGTAWDDANARLILTDTDDGSHLLDIYGEFGVESTGQPWDYLYGYSYRLPEYNTGDGGTFVASEWFLGGPGSLEGPDEEELLLTLTTPGTHEFEPCSSCGTQQRADASCDGVVNAFDIDPFVLALTAPASWDATYGSGGLGCDLTCTCDCNGDGAVNAFDIDPFVLILTGGGR
jgi:hypothetical protein